MNDQERPPRAVGWRILGCLVKAPLGCLAFFLGGLVVLVIFLPPALGNLLAVSATNLFDETYAGSLEVHSPWIGSFYGPQEVKRIVLNDPDGVEILHGAISAPSLFTIFEDGVDSDWGPVQFRIGTIEIVEDAEGISNLQRALARTDTDATQPGDGERVWDWEPSQLAIDVVIDRLAWSDAVGRAFAVRDIACRVDLTAKADGFRIEASGKGVFDDGLGEEIRFDWHVDDLYADSSARAPWAFEIDSGRAPVALLFALFSSLGELETALGYELDSLHAEISSNARGDRRIEALDVRSPELHVEWRSAWIESSAQLVSSRGDVATLRFPSGTGWADERLGQLLPLAIDHRHGAPERWTTVYLEDFVIPLDGKFEEIEASIELDVEDEFSIRLVHTIREKLRLPERSRPPGSFRVESGRVHYDSFGDSTKSDALMFDGTYDLATKSYALLVTLSDASVFEVRGLIDALEIERLPNH